MSEMTTTRSLNHGWHFRELHPAALPNTQTDRWLPAAVPGHVHLDLQRLGLIPDPFQQMYERTVQWVDEIDWVYQTSFTMHKQELSDTQHLLCFNGLDTIARVQLNNTLLGESDNMFIAHEFDVTGLLQEGENTLTVEFTSAERTGTERKATLFAQEGPEFAVYDRALMPRSFVRKAQYMFGWDWGPRLRSCGIWQDVELMRIPVARIANWSYSTSFDGEGGDGCRVTFQVHIEGENRSASHVAVTLTLDDMHISGQVEVHGPDSSVTLDLATAQRWWPNGYGMPTLYDVDIVLMADDEMLDRRRGRIGLREVELVREPDAIGETFFFRINGVPIYAKGANWIPADSFPARVMPARYRANLELAHAAGMNMLRIWGGGLYETETFYTLCDELGLMVWQDFPFACAFYPEDEAFAEAIRSEATAAIRRLRTHPSLVLYCGNNENQQAGYQHWFGPTPYSLGDRLYEEVLPAVVRAEDPTRPYWPGSPYGGDDPTDERIGDAHYWNVWHGAGDWIYYRDCNARFISEFGFASPPAESTLTAALAPTHLGVDTFGMRWHDKTSKGYETYLNFIALHYPMPTTLPDLVYYGQLNQAEGMKFGIEHFRRLRPHTMGTLVWQLNDCWPVQSWSWVDYNLHPKAAWYYARRFFAPLLVSIVRTNEHIEVYLTNDRRDPVVGTLELRAIDETGHISWHQEGQASIEALTSGVVMTGELPPEVLASAEHSIVYVRFSPLTGEPVDNSLLLVEPKELRLRPPHIQFEANQGVEPGTIELRFTTQTIALGVMLSLLDSEADWSDNFFHLLPGASTTITVTPTRPLQPEEVAARLRWRAL